MLLPEECVASETSTQSSYPQRSSRRELPSNFRRLENQRNDLAEEELIMMIKPLNIQSPMSQPALMNFNNQFDPRWSTKPPSLILPKQKAQLNDPKLKPFIEENKYLELPDYPRKKLNGYNIHQCNFIEPEDVYKFLLENEYALYKRFEKSNIKLQYKYTGDIKEGLRHGYGKLEVVDSNNQNKVYYLCYEGLFLCGGFHSKNQIYINKATNFWYKGDYICGHEWGYGEEGDGYVDLNFKLKAYYEKGIPQKDVTKSDYNDNISQSYEGDFTLNKNQRKMFHGYGRVSNQKNSLGFNRIFFKNGHFENNKMKSGRIYMSEKISEVFYESNSTNDKNRKNTVKHFKIKYNTDGTISSYEQY